MRRFSRLLGTAKPRNLVPAQEFFRSNESLIEKARVALQEDGGRFVVFLEAGEGAGRTEILRRLSKQHYETFALNFVDWMVRHDYAELTAERAWKWQLEFCHGVLSRMQEPNAKGFLFVKGSPFSSALNLSRRGIAFEPRKLQIPQHFCVLNLECDPIQAARRNAEKTFDEPTSRASKLREHLREGMDVQGGSIGLKYDDTLNSTSTKQCTAALLKLIGEEFSLPPHS